MWRPGWDSYCKWGLEVEEASLIKQVKADGTLETVQSPKPTAAGANSIGCKCADSTPKLYEVPLKITSGAEPLWQRNEKFKNNPWNPNRIDYRSKKGLRHIKNVRCSIWKLKQGHYKDNKHLLYPPEEGECKENGHINLGEFQGSA